MQRVGLFSRILGLSLLGLALAQTNGESMSSAYDITTAIFSNPPTVAGGNHIWQWSAFDSTRQRTNDHNLRTGPDVVWKVVLPECFDSMVVHFAYHDDGGDGSFPSDNVVYIINATTGDTAELKENSYEDHMLLWTLGRTDWVTLGSGSGFSGPGTANLIGYHTSTLYKASTGNGSGFPLLGDTLRLQAGDELYFIYTHNNNGPGSVDSVYLELVFVQKVRPTPHPLDLSVQITYPSPLTPPYCLAAGPTSTPLPVSEWTATDTVNDGRDPSAYEFSLSVYHTGILQSGNSGTFIATSPTGSGIIALSGPNAPSLSQGYVNYEEVWSVRGIYSHPLYPNASVCKDTTAPSSTVTASTNACIQPSGAIRYSSTTYTSGTISVPLNQPVTFEAVEQRGISSAVLGYRWFVDGGTTPAGTSQSYTHTFTTAGTHSISLEIENASAGCNPPACSAAPVALTVDVTTALVEGIQATAREGLLHLWLPEGGPYKVALYDLQGRKLWSQSLSGSGPHTLTPSVRGVVLLQVTSPTLHHNQRLLLE